MDEGTGMGIVVGQLFILLETRHLDVTINAKIRDQTTKIGTQCPVA
jgi:hypothetical protein